MKINKIIGAYDSNTYVAGNAKEVVIIDGGAVAADVIKAVGKRKVLGILITHEHFDHLTYCADYAKRFNAKIYCSIEALFYLLYDPKIVTEGIAYKIAQLSDDKNVSLIRNENEFTLGDMTVKPYLLPGHSSGSIVYCIGGDMFTGDVLFSRGVGRIDLMTNGKKYMTETLNRLKDIKFETAHHGHGESSTYDVQQLNIVSSVKWLSRQAD